MGRCRRRAAIATVACAASLLAAAPASAGYSAYVVNYGDGTVSQYSLNARGSLSPTMGAPTVPAGLSGSNPYNIALDARGKHAYVTSYGNDAVFQYGIGAGGTLSPLSQTDVVAGTGPYPVAASPDAKHLYVGNYGESTVSEYRIRAGGMLSPSSNAPAVATGSHPYDIVETPNGRNLYVANYGRRSVSEYSVRAGGTLSPRSDAPTVKAGQHPSGMAVTPNGRYLYVTNYSSDSVSAYSIGKHGALSRLHVPTVKTRTGPFGIAITPNGRYVYVTDEGADTVSGYTIGKHGTLSPAGKPTTTGLGPYALAISPSGKALYVANDNGNDVSQYTIGKHGALTPKATPRVATGLDPWGIIVTPDSGPVASFTASPRAAGKTSRFQAHASDPDEPVAGYVWRFGDGHAGAGKKVSHVYARAGRYTVTLTETDRIGCSAHGRFKGKAGRYTGHLPYCALDPAAVSRATVVVK